MRFGSLQNSASYKNVLRGPVWQEVFGWLERALAVAPADGTYVIRDPGVHVIVRTLITKARDEVDFEAHRREVDVHACLVGSEWIDWAVTSALKPSTAYDEEIDVTLYDPPDRAAQITLTEGTFVVFFPEEAHRPGITYRDPVTRKAVVKISRALLP